MISERTFFFWLPEIILLIGIFFWLIGNIVDSSTERNAGKGIKIFSVILMAIYLVYSFYRIWLK